VTSGFQAAGSYWLTDQPAEDRSTPDSAVDRLGDTRFRARWTQLQRSMRSACVVVRGIHGKRQVEMLLSEDQHAVGEFGADGQHEAFGVAVRARAPRRDLDHLDARICEHRVERARVVSGPITDEEPERRYLFAEVRDEVAGLLRGPRPVRVRVGFQNPAIVCDQRFQAAGS
jgi:hypothetical protein